LNAFDLKIKFTILKDTADLIVSAAVGDAGFESLVIIDDGWQASTRDPNERQQVNSTLFPKGIAGLTD